jgi:hypothetical protein
MTAGTTQIEAASIAMIDVTQENVPAVAAAAWGALRVAGDTERPQFVRVGNTACVRTDEGLQALERGSLTYWLARAAVFYKVMKKGEKTVKPPQWLVADMLAAPVPDLPEEAQ